MSPRSPNEVGRIVADERGIEARPSGVDPERSRRLDGKVALVTGASSGIGLACTRALAEAGARVAMLARGRDRLDAAVEELLAAGHEVVGIVGDVREPSTVDRFVEAALAEFGSVDVLVNNAGGSQGDAFRRAPLLDLDIEDLRGAMELNLVPTFSCSKAAVSAMGSSGGSIVNVASVVAFRPRRSFGFYGPAKAAVMSLTMLMAEEWAPDVRVNAVVPGSVATGTQRSPERIAQLVAGIAMGRLGEPADVAALVRFLASDEAAWITGAMFDVDGGVRSGV